jgi:hypothetical protein
MNQNIWGSHLWFSLHTITFNYPLKPNYEDKTNYKNFFLNMQHVIPCSICKKNYIRHLKEHPIDNFLDNRKKIVYWLIDMHNMVNGEIGKKILSYDIVLKKYEDVYNKKIILNEDIKSENEIFENNDDDNDDDDDDNKNKNKNIKINYKNIEINKHIYKNKRIVYYLFIFFIILLSINLIYLINKKY